jgi:hypothetical protein
VVIAGGTCDDSVGWFVQPTVLEVSDPRSEFMIDELFAPVMTVYVYSRPCLGHRRRACRRLYRVRPHRCGLRIGRGRDRAGRPGAALCRGQLLHQRSADRCSCWPSTFRRCPRIWHQRQGRHGVESHPLHQPTVGETQATPRSRYPIPCTRWLRTTYLDQCTTAK